MKSHVYIGIYLLVFLLILCTIPVVVFFSSIPNAIVRTLFYVGASGGIGGSIYSIRGFYQNLGGKTFETNWIWWYIFRPVISTFLMLVNNKVYYGNYDCFTLMLIPIFLTTISATIIDRSPLIV